MERELVAVPEEDAWRLPYLAKLLERRQRQYYLGLGTEEVQELILTLYVRYCVPNQLFLNVYNIYPVPTS